MNLNLTKGEVELLDRLATGLELTRTDYVRQLLWGAAEGAPLCPRCWGAGLVKIGSLQAGDQIESEYGPCPLCVEEDHEPR